MKRLTLNYKGRDDCSRPVYKCNGILYVDVEPFKNRKPDICTKYGNEFNGEPDCHIKHEIELEFIPFRNTWDF